jgi:hypothetical protein
MKPNTNTPFFRISINSDLIKSLSVESYDGDKSQEGFFFRRKISKKEFEFKELPKIKSFYDLIMKEAKKYFSGIKVLNKGVRLKENFEIEKTSSGDLFIELVHYDNWEICVTLGFMKKGEQKLPDELWDMYDGIENLVDEKCFNPFFDRFNTQLKPYKDIFTLGGEGDRDGGYYHLNIVPKVV